MTKRLLLSLTIMFSLMMLFGCGDNSNVTAPDTTGSIQLVQRPEFIDTRPQAVIDSHILVGNASMDIPASKPTPPAPDPAGPDPNPNPAHKYAYVVGISDYEGTANDLQFCDDDAYDMAAFYTSQGFTVRMDVDGDATADNITAGLQWLASAAVAGDEIAFSYSGHGNKLSVGSVIISADLYYLTHSYVMDIINSTNCTKMLVTIDACKVGSFLYDGINGSVIACASDNTYSYDAPDLNNGAWTYYFVAAATGGYVYAEDIAYQAELGMRAWAALYRLRVSPAHTDNYEGTGGLDI